MLTSFKTRIMHWSRFRKLDHFYSLCDPTSLVLNVGVSSNEHNSQINPFLRTFKFSSEQYTGLAVDPMAKLREKYPDKTFVEYAGHKFPFNDNEFDWIFSNAVVEHVGSRKEQILHVNEMLRVSKNVFFTTPNKYFPVESHTNILFQHWFNNHFYTWCKANQPFWTPENLLLFGSGDLTTLMIKSDAKNYQIQKNRLFGWPMTFTVVCNS